MKRKSRSTVGPYRALRKPKTIALRQIRQALTAYHHALDTRQHGDVAADNFVKAVQEILGQPWVPGATIK